MNLAIMTELPLIVINIQRGGPSTGLPTKTEQSDLLQAMWGRNGDSPIVLLAPQSPSDCFDIALEAWRIAAQHMVPVVILSDGYLGNGSEPWKLPDPTALDPIEITHATDPENFEKVSGRGLMLIQAFMDEVSHSANGSEITMIKRPASDDDDDDDD